MVRAIMHGCNGKMGRVITGLIRDDDAIEIVAGIDTYTGTANDYPVFESIEACDVEADVVIDFSNAGAVDALLDICWITVQRRSFQWYFAPPDFRKSSFGRWKKLQSRPLY